MKAGNETLIPFHPKQTSTVLKSQVSRCYSPVPFSSCTKLRMSAAGYPPEGPESVLTSRFTHVAQRLLHDFGVEAELAQGTSSSARLNVWPTSRDLQESLAAPGLVPQGGAEVSQSSYGRLEGVRDVEGGIVERVFAAEASVDTAVLVDDVRTERLLLLGWAPIFGGPHAYRHTVG